MPKITVDVKSYNRVENKLRRLASEYRDVLDSVVADWTKDMRAKLKGRGYPPQSNAPQPFKTERQRRWFFWALSTGRITVPYQRTGRLANSFSAQKHGAAHWRIHNSAEYASWVVDRKGQSGYHRPTWWTAQDVMEEEFPTLTSNLSKEIMGLVK